MNLENPLPPTHRCVTLFLSYCDKRAAGCARFAWPSDVTSCDGLTSRRVTVWRHVSPGEPPAIRHIHVKKERYVWVNFLGPGPRLKKKEFYRAAVSQRLRNTALDHFATGTGVYMTATQELERRHIKFDWTVRIVIRVIIWVSKHEPSLIPSNTFPHSQQYLPSFPVIPSLIPSNTFPHSQQYLPSFPAIPSLIPSNTFPHSQQYLP